jgi:DNA modification methylase
MIPEARYLKLQEAGREFDAFQYPYEAIRGVYDELKKRYDVEVAGAFYSSRAFFDNCHDNMTEVWAFPRVLGEERHGHATPKPVLMIARAIKSSCPEGEIVLEPFAGSGSTLIAAEETGRRCFTMDLVPEWVATSIARWEAKTGAKAVLIRSGAETSAEGAA